MKWHSIYYKRGTWRRNIIHIRVCTCCWERGEMYSWKKELLSHHQYWFIWTKSEIHKSLSIYLATCLNTNDEMRLNTFQHIKKVPCFPFVLATVLFEVRSHLHVYRQWKFSFCFCNYSMLGLLMFLVCFFNKVIPMKHENVQDK